MLSTSRSIFPQNLHPFSQISTNDLMRPIFFANSNAGKKRKKDCTSGSRHFLRSLHCQQNTYQPTVFCKSTDRFVAQKSPATTSYGLFVTIVQSMQAVQQKSTPLSPHLLPSLLTQQTISKRAVLFSDTPYISVSVEESVILFSSCSMSSKLLCLY